MRFKHVMSCIKIDTLGFNGVCVSITNCAYVYCSYVRNHAFSIYASKCKFMFFRLTYLYIRAHYKKSTKMKKKKHIAKAIVD
ncbi:hypothetical protein T03_9991 [Trichinella britovi]|uniref:Uncharacterized protein n=1 Tax=Trichinella britovi TaxID=45882 RepID=A0A0V1CVU5_TRIBR|nr:hypothetical protein T03_9991 [Trichinella britovi]